MGIDYVTGKCLLIITSIIHLYYICGNSHVRNRFDVIMRKLEQGIKMLLGNSFIIREGKASRRHLPVLSCHLSHSKELLKLTIYLVYCLLGREYSMYFPFIGLF